MTASASMVARARTFAAKTASGLVVFTHSSFALLGLAVAFLAIVLFARPDLRHTGEEHLRGWLQARQPVAAEPVEVVQAKTEPAAAPPKNVADTPRPIAINPQQLPREQAAVAYWLSKKYRVAPEPLAALVTEAYELGRRAKLDPTLILAIVAIESSFNPFAQSSVGAQGLMQVMTRVHTDKYQSVGGHLAAFNPLTNLRVGVQVLQECISRAGSLEGGLRYYVGAANLPHDGGYAAKVLAEHFRLRQVAGGRAASPAPAPAKPVLSTKAPAEDGPSAALPASADKVAMLAGA